MDNIYIETIDITTYYYGWYISRMYCFAWNEI